MTQPPNITSERDVVLARYLSSFPHDARYRDLFASRARCLAPPPDSLLTPAEAARKPYKPRRPPLDSLLKQAAKAGKSVKGAEVYQDRTVLQFGEPAPVEPENPWPLDEFRTKETKQ